MRAVLPFFLAALVLLGGIDPGLSEVRFGNNVRIGGHDFSRRSYRRVHVQTVRRLPGPEGCRRVRHGRYVRGDGTTVRGPMKVCNLRSISPAQRPGASR